jgi:hypothetical protein
MDIGGPFPGGKSAAGAWCWPLTPIYCRGRECVGSIPPLPTSASMVCSGTALIFTAVSILFDLTACQVPLRHSRVWPQTAASGLVRCIVCRTSLTLEDWWNGIRKAIEDFSVNTAITFIFLGTGTIVQNSWYRSTTILITDTFFTTLLNHMNCKKVKQPLYTPWRRLGGRGGIAPTHYRPRH